jgi:hypothetical protein
MRAHIVIAVLAALAMFAVAHMASTEDRVIGDPDPDCTVDCSGQNTDNGGSSLTVAPDNDPASDNN